jgi:predicted nucleotidyltransferase component of viral defense system
MYAHGSKVDLMVAEKDVILTYVLKILSDAKFSDLVFKGGTCIRKIYLGRISRFSEDLDFQGKKKSIRELVDGIYELFCDREKYGIKFSFSDDDYYESKDSIGANISYSHEWNPGSTFKFQISLRDDFILDPLDLVIKEENYCKWLEFSLPPVPCMQWEEIIAEKVRACYQRSTVKDVYNLFLFSSKPFDHELIRSLVVLKMWSVHEQFDPFEFLDSMSTENYDWHDLERLIRSDSLPEPAAVVDGVKKRFSFLKEFNEEELTLIDDAKRHRALDVRNASVKKVIDAVTYPKR